MLSLYEKLIIRNWCIVYAVKCEHLYDKNPIETDEKKESAYFWTNKKY